MNEAHGRAEVRQILAQLWKPPLIANSNRRAFAIPYRARRFKRPVAPVDDEKPFLFLQAGALPKISG